MDARIRFLVLLVLGVLRTSSSRQLPRNLEAMNYPEQESGYLVRNDRMCTLCKEYAATALDYLSKNKTQREIIELLRISCTQLGAFKPECVAFVDHYAPLLLSEISSIEPDDFCKKVSLCKEVIVTDIFTDRGGWLCIFSECCSRIITQRSVGMLFRKVHRIGSDMNGVIPDKIM